MSFCLWGSGYPAQLYPNLCYLLIVVAIPSAAVRPAFVLGVLPPTAWGWGPDPRLDAGAVSNGLVIIEDTLKDPRQVYLQRACGGVCDFMESLSGSLLC